MTTIMMQCNFCGRGHTLLWVVPESGDPSNLGGYTCSAFPKAIPAYISLEVSAPGGSNKKCPKFIVSQTMHEDDRELMAEMPWFSKAG